MQDLVRHIVEIGWQVDHIGAISRIGLEEIIPQHDAILIGKVIAVRTCASAHPIAEHVEIGKRVHMKLGIEAIIMLSNLSERMLVTNGFLIKTGPLKVSVTDCLIPGSRSRTAISQSHPMVDRQIVPSSAVSPPFFPIP
jgi:hypothetical protein